MPRMIGYLGGDANTLVARRAEENDLRVAVEFVDHNQMIVFVVMQDGTIAVNASKIRGRDAIDDLKVIGSFIQFGDDIDIVLYDTDRTITPTSKPAEFHHLRVVRENDDD